MKLRYKFATQKVGSGVVAVTIGEDAFKYSEVLRMNTTGAFILKQLQNDISYVDLMKCMLQKYDTDKATVEKLLVGFLGILVEKELLVDEKMKVITKAALLGD